MFYNDRMRFGFTGFDGCCGLSNPLSAVLDFRHRMLADLFSQARVLISQVLPPSFESVDFPVLRRAVNLPLPTYNSRIRTGSSELCHYSSGLLVVLVPVPRRFPLKACEISDGLLTLFSLGASPGVRKLAG